MSARFVLRKPVKKTGLDWFNQANLGIIIHWGPYSVPGYDDVSNINRRKIKNGSEWYYSRLTKEYRPPGGAAATRKYHADNYEGWDYTDFATEFTAQNWQPDEWVDLFVSAGVKYVIITAKHHDGFCLWPNGKTWNNKESEVILWNSKDTGPHRDIVGELKIACQKRGLKFGVYYSLLQWEPTLVHSSPTIKYIDNVMLPELWDLYNRYKPDIFWFDGCWGKTRKQWRLEPFLFELKKVGIITNDRLGQDKDETFGDYQNFEDRFIPEEKLATKWESVMTIGHSWGYNRAQTPKDYKNGSQIFDIYNEVVEKGGNLLLNFGPQADGTLDPQEVQSFKEFSKLLNN